MKIKIVHRLFSSYLFAVFMSPLVFGQQLYFVENQNGKTFKSDINGDVVTELFSDSIGMYGIATDFKNRKIYSTNVLTDEIFISNLDGSSVSALLNNSDDKVDGPRGIAVDNINNRIYWAESNSGKIRSSDLNGLDTMTIISGLSSPVDVALDLVNNKLYWSDNGIGAKKISSCNLDGTDTITVVDQLDQVGGIEIDVENGKLYWIDFGDSNSIGMANLDGASSQILTNLGVGSPRGLAMDRDAGKLFWTDGLGSKISKMNLNGTSKITIDSVRANPIGISANNPATIPIYASLRVFIEGARDSSNPSSVRTDLQEFIPIISPYSEDNRIIDSVHSEIVDWVLVELRETENGLTIDSKSALLHRDGRIVADDGNSGTIKFDAEPGDYYIVVKHRNHLSIMSVAPVTLTN